MQNFSGSIFQKHLKTRQYGRFLIHRETTKSTMDIAAREAKEGGSNGTIVLAESMTSGRGTKGRKWTSVATGNLYFSILTYVQENNEMLMFPFAAALAVQKAINNQLKGNKAKVFYLKNVFDILKLKWPNDVWVGNKKICGILAECHEFKKKALVIGIGINVNEDVSQNEYIKDIATSLYCELKQPVQREIVLADFCNELEKLLTLPKKEIAYLYAKENLLIGKEVVVKPLAESETYTVTAIDINEKGCLVVKKGDVTIELKSEDVSVRRGD